MKKEMSVSPTKGELVNGSSVLYPQAGMTLRDYFAGQALSAIAGITEDGDAYTHRILTVKQIARESYQLADAMLEAREEV